MDWNIARPINGILTKLTSIVDRKLPMNYQPVQHFTPSLWNNKIVLKTWKKKLIRLHLFVYPNWWLEIFNSRCPNFPQYIDSFRRKCNFWCLLTVFLQTYFWGTIYPALCFLFNSSRGWLSIYTDEPWKGLKSTCLILLGFHTTQKSFITAPLELATLFIILDFQVAKPNQLNPY